MRYKFTPVFKVKDMADILQIASISQQEFTELLRTVVREELTAIQQDSAPKYLSRQEAAEMLHITLPTLWEYTKLGLIEGSRIGRRVLYSQEAVQEAVKTIPSMKYKRR